MNIELYIENKIVELDNEFNLRLNKEFYETEALTTTDVSYSFTVNIPTTQHNKEIFSYVDTEEVPNKFGQVYNATLFVNSTLIMDGKYINNEIDGDYFQGNLYTPSQKQLKDILGDITLNQIVAHNFNLNDWNDLYNINASYLFNQNKDNHIIFPYVLYNLPYMVSTTTDKYTQQHSYKNGASWNIDNLLPAFKVASVLKDCFKTFNLNLEGNIFTDSRFTQLYQTYQGKHEDYMAKRESPFVCSFNLKYQTRLNNNNDSFISEISAKDGIQAYSTDLCLSENTVITGKDDKYNMITSNNYIKIPKTGWYRIGSYGQFYYPTTWKDRWKQSNRVHVSGCESKKDKSYLDNKPLEFQINRSSSGTFSTPTYLGIYGFDPTQPNVDAGYEKSWYDGWVRYPSGTYFPQNQRTLTINDSNDVITDYFVAGARFGQRDINQHHGNDRGLKGGMLYCNPDPNKMDANYQSSSENYLYKYSMSNSTYGWQTANPMLRGIGENIRAFHTSSGYNRLDIDQDDNGNYQKNWTLNTNYNQRTINGLGNSIAISQSNSKGTWDLEQVIWLEKGEYLNMNLIMPTQFYGDKCKWYERCPSGYKHQSTCCVNTNINTSIRVAYINSNADWDYQTEMVPDWNQLALPKTTNVNSMLPNIKVNDYLNNLIQTFNLKLSKVNSNTYSLDTPNLKNEIGEIIDIQPYVDINKNKYSRIDLPSEYQFLFKNNLEEEGYLQKGENNLMPQYYTGNATYSNPANTSNSVIKKESIFSFNWYKNINWVTNTTTVLSTPVIGNAEIWNDSLTYLQALDKGLYTDNTFRLFYADRNTYFFAEISPSEVLYLIKANDVNADNRLRLTFDKNEPLSITNQMFDVKLSTGHQVETSCFLPNQLYNKIKNNSRIKMNDSLYKVSSIEGFDPLEEEETTLILINE